MWIIAGIFACIGIWFAYLGFSSTGTDIQLTIGLVSMFSAVILLVVGDNSMKLAEIKNNQREAKVHSTPAKDTVKTSTRKVVKKTSFADALETYKSDQQLEITHGDAIRDLASDRLKELGYLS